MFRKIHIFFFIIIFNLAWQNNIVACEMTKTKTESSCCKEKESQTTKSDDCCCNQKNENKSSADCCGGTCNHSSCKCISSNGSIL